MHTIGTTSPKEGDEMKENEDVLKMRLQMNLLKKIDDIRMRQKKFCSKVTLLNRKGT